jgi:radical SAM superfamily enzyme YgiQ (UPF0313 family)
MKVLLVNVPYLQVYEEVAGGVGAYMPLGLAYIASTLREKGHQVEAVDYGIEPYSDQSFRGLLKHLSPQVVGYSFATASFGMARHLISLAKEALPQHLAVGGGCHASSDPSSTIARTRLDIAVCGEGERVMSEIAEGVSLSQIKGVTYRNDRREIVSNGRAPLIGYLDALPFPARDLFPTSKYQPHVYYRRNAPWTNMITSRGCPYGCVFCASNAVFQRKYRTRSVENVISEILHVTERYGIRDITFVDDEFTLDRKRTLELCDRIQQEGIDITWYCFARVDNVTPDLLRAMKKAGCYYILYGVESGNRDVLAATRKGITLDQATKAILWTREAGILSCATFMIGLPHETESTIKETIRFAKELDPDWAFFNITIPLPGSELHELIRKEGSMVTRDYEHFAAMSSMPVYSPAGISPDKLTEWAARAHLDFYSQPHVIWRRIRQCRSPREFAELTKGLVAGLRQIHRWSR